MKIGKKIIKNFLLVSLFLLIINMLNGCKKNPSFYKKDYKLSMKDGVVKCDNFDYVVCLEKTKNKDFKILNFADVQLSKADINFGGGISEYALQIIDELINETNPDLITLSGDQGYGEPDSINAISEAINAHNIPWAFAFGNHDQECNELSMSEQVDLYCSYSNCIGKYGPSEVTSSFVKAERAGNYIINVVEKDDTSFKIIRSIFILNSGQSYGTYNDTNKINGANYENLNEKQLDFYKWGLECAKKYNNGIYPKSTIIQHIPLTAYAFAFAEAFNTSYSAYEFGSIVEEAKKVSVEDSYKASTWKEGYNDSFGVCYETVMSKPIDDHIFEVLKEYGSTDSLLVGHDHVNNYCINYQGIKLAYSLKTGIGSYSNSKLNGGTVLSFDNSNITIEHIYK